MGVFSNRDREESIVMKEEPVVRDVCDLGGGGLFEDFLCEALRHAGMIDVGGHVEGTWHITEGVNIIAGSELSNETLSASQGCGVTTRRSTTGFARKGGCVLR